MTINLTQIKLRDYILAIRKKESHYITQNPAVKEKEEKRVYESYYIRKYRKRKRKR